MPSLEGPAQRSDLGWEVAALEISGKFIEVAAGVLGFGDVVEEPDCFLRMPGVGDLPSGVAEVLLAFGVGPSLAPGSPIDRARTTPSLRLSPHRSNHLAQRRGPPRRGCPTHGPLRRNPRPGICRSAQRRRRCSQPSHRRLHASFDGLRRRSLMRPTDYRQSRRFGVVRPEAWRSHVRRGNSHGRLRAFAARPPTQLFEVGDNASERLSIEQARQSRPHSAPPCLHRRSGRPSLGPGPGPDELLGASTTDLKILWNGPTESLHDAIAPHGGDVVLHSEQLSLYLVSFPTGDVAELVAIRDQLRAEGFDTSVDLVSNDPTTGG